MIVFPKFILNLVILKLDKTIFTFPPPAASSPAPRTENVEMFHGTSLRYRIIVKEGDGEITGKLIEEMSSHRQGKRQ